MRESSIIIEGKIKEFARSEAGNLAFMVEDSGGSIHYCYSPVKEVSIAISDDVVIYGNSHSYYSNKIRVNYILNKTRNTENVLIERKQSWTYTVSFVFSILITALFVISLLVLVRIIPVNFLGVLDSIFSSVFSMIMVILLAPVLIIMWVLTSAFGKKRSESEELAKRIKDMKENLGISETSKTSSPQKQLDVESEKTTTATKFCSHCGEKLPPEAKFCSKCGAKWD